MSTLTITEFLEARIAEDEREAQSALALRGSGTHWRIGHPLDPARVLAACAAKRAILADWPDVFGVWSADEAAAASAVKELTRKRLAAVYASHADYQPEWAL